MRTKVLLDSVSTTGAGSTVEVEANRITLYRISVTASTHGTTVLQLQTPSGSWVNIPDASSTADDAYEVHLAPGDKVRGNITAGSPSNVTMYMKGLGSL